MHPVSVLTHGDSTHGGEPAGARARRTRRAAVYPAARGHLVAAVKRSKYSRPVWTMPCGMTAHGACDDWTTENHTGMKAQPCWPCDTGAACTGVAAPEPDARLPTELKLKSKRAGMEVQPCVCTGVAAPEPDAKLPTELKLVSKPASLSASVVLLRSAETFRRIIAQAAESRVCASGGGSKGSSKMLGARPLSSTVLRVLSSRFSSCNRCNSSWSAVNAAPEGPTASDATGVASGSRPAASSTGIAACAGVTVIAGAASRADVTGASPDVFPMTAQGVAEQTSNKSLYFLDGVSSSSGASASSTAPTDALRPSCHDNRSLRQLKTADSKCFIFFNRR
mmetsp:Transcript_85083/g.259951  ORF Transcript_85083/g.259951 Transcript_85083/m.259951 type:complete len:337 (-) Transcript_85083:587-1597(-)